MKKSDLIIAGVLAVLMFAWMYFFPAAKPAPTAEEGEAAADTNALTQVIDEAAPELNAVVEAAADQVVAEVEELAPEEFLWLENEFVTLKISSHGGAVVSAVLHEYPALNTPDSSALMLDFSSDPALRYDGLPLMAGTLVEADGGLVYTAPVGDGQVLKRTLTLDGDYLLSVQDEFVNTSETPWALPALRLPTGPMANPEEMSSMRGMTTLGVDSYTADDGVSHWGNRFRKQAKGEVEFTSTPGMLEVDPAPVGWVAAKNKFFVQILTQQEGQSAGFDYTVRREGEGKKLAAAEVIAAIQYPKELVGGGESVVRRVQSYIGPKKFKLLKAFDDSQADVMEFKSTGFWRFMNPIMYPIKLALLWGLVHLAPFGNYGIAILILTVIVRVIFWPLTHKSTESMKRMQELQPQMKEIKEKYKDNPQRMQQETMTLYKENKVNPMGGCLPMVIQIPVFIALFRVLRSAIELRFSKFLWISDLSEPENLFAGAFKLPLLGWDAVNILPLLMAATMMMQQKLMPSAAAATTPEQQQQQKMMQVMMPVMMLFFFYTMPSGLVLYYTASQVIMIAQLLIRKKKTA